MQTSTEDEEMLNLTTLSPEVLHNLLSFCEIQSLAHLTQTCHFLRNFITRDDLLWKRMYLSKFDEPRVVPASWSAATRHLMALERIFESNNFDLKRKHTADIAKSIFSLFSNVNTTDPVKNTEFLTKHLHHDRRRNNATTFTRQSSLFRYCGMPFDEAANSIYLRQLSAKLHVYYGCSLEIRPSELADVPAAIQTDAFARSRVYDLRRYKARNHWGPFMDDGSGRIDWEKVQSIFIVLAHGLRMLCERSNGAIGPFWDTPFEGLATGSYRPMIYKREQDDEETAAARESISSLYGTSSSSPHDQEHESDSATVGSSRSSTEPPTSIPDLDRFYLKFDDPREAEFQHQQLEFAAQDPYGVRGTWMRIVNFLDYHDLFAFNFGGPVPAAGEEREPVATAEAYRLILLKLWVTRIEWPEEDAESEADWQTVSGSGSSRADSSSQDTQDDTSRSTNVDTPSPVPEMNPTLQPPVEERVALSEQDQPVPQESGPVLDAASSNGKARASSPEDLAASSNTLKPKRKRMPIVHFAGKSRSLHVRWDPNANSHIRGTVRGFFPSPTPPHEYLPDDPARPPSPNLNHIYPHQPPSPVRRPAYRPLRCNHPHGDETGSGPESLPSPHPDTDDTPLPPLMPISSQSSQSSSMRPNQHDSIASQNTPDQSNSTAELPGIVDEPEMVVRWTTFSVFHGEERWRSEGVQIGGLKSGRGVLGNWFDKDFDPHGPAGPTGFWKLSDTVEMYTRNRVAPNVWGDDD